MTGSTFNKIITKSSRRRRSKVVLALDVFHASRAKLLRTAESLLRNVEPYICGLKLNQHLVLSLGLFEGVKRLVSLAHRYGLPTIMDAKLNDIAPTNAAIAKNYFGAGFDAMIANPIVGWEGGMDGLFKASRASRKGVLLLVYMSHPASGEGYGQLVLDPSTIAPRPLFEIFAEKAVEWRADGVIVGATYPEKVARVKKIVGETPIYSPGVGAQGGDLVTALRSGATYVIIGRQIYGARNPEAAAEKLCAASRQ